MSSAAVAMAPKAATTRGAKASPRRRAEVPQGAVRALGPGVPPVAGPTVAPTTSPARGGTASAVKSTQPPPRPVPQRTLPPPEPTPSGALRWIPVIVVVVFLFIAVTLFSNAAGEGIRPSRSLQCCDLAHDHAGRRTAAFKVAVQATHLSRGKSVAVRRLILGSASQRAAFLKELGALLPGATVVRVDMSSGVSLFNSLGEIAQKSCCLVIVAENLDTASREACEALKSLFETGGTGGVRYITGRALFVGGADPTASLASVPDRVKFMLTNVTL